MERKSCCSRSKSVASPYSVPPKKEDVKPDITEKEIVQEAVVSQLAVPANQKIPKVEKKDPVSEKKEEPVEVNVGSGAGGFLPCSWFLSCYDVLSMALQTGQKETSIFLNSQELYLVGLRVETAYDILDGKESIGDPTGYTTYTSLLKAYLRSLQMRKAGSAINTSDEMISPQLTLWDIDHAIEYYNRTSMPKFPNWSFFDNPVATPPKKETKTSCYVSTSCVSTPKREQPVKKTQVSQEETTSQIPKTEEEEKQQAVTVKQEEPVKVNVGN
ncbi:hypothetical protein JRO89_XS03G0325200 [Xanthoceras sorbifolium]|uniref:Uncharacterized protein n=1 Tax=Xanthoceras sorbifolium TaxID=99658 RepID=A0ABQ8IDA0_9ROSI|nr:hypothetical protein JRO89_XS03G0325200 [Xanthoceras sorbifolium]